MDEIITITLTLSALNAQRIRALVDAATNAALNSKATDQEFYAIADPLSEITEILETAFQTQTAVSLQ